MAVGVAVADLNDRPRRNHFEFRLVRSYPLLNNPGDFFWIDFHYGNLLNTFILMKFFLLFFLICKVRWRR